MKLQNTTKKLFSFEGTQIEAGQVKEVGDAIAQKLLAMYWHKGLELVEKEETKPEIREEGKVTCPNCPGRLFASERAMKTHQQLSGCKKLKTNGNS